MVTSSTGADASSWCRASTLPALVASSRAAIPSETPAPAATRTSARVIACTRQREVPALSSWLLPAGTGSLGLVAALATKRKSARPSRSCS
jgi:hypothetical protein